MSWNVGCNAKTKEEALKYIEGEQKKHATYFPLEDAQAVLNLVRRVEQPAAGYSLDVEASGHSDTHGAQMNVKITTYKARLE